MPAEDPGQQRDSLRAHRPSRRGFRGGPEAGRIPTVAVLGNPNAGKSTVFNRLTGLSQKVGNYPGVTVERKEGFVHLEGRTLRLLDLPGTYSLAAHSLDEIVAVDVLLGHQQGEARPDLVLHVVDSSNLERNLYLLTQICELGLPVLVVLNMVDVAERKGIQIEVEIDDYHLSLRKAEAALVEVTRL